ncbi:hypothetical protein C1701_23210 [Actinoalloteichus sp. AHMU CJ021]|uniref:FAD-NAD(P)-binding n=1 Tax=Actinoalloteichus caeruleus DSM 43889 TaxID=1120930 RepID=A0ABT1JCF8_ACTCY|nr:FAD/NAD(P)-binding protein [Actinoalloteichus caeruleus]AUS80771.1 hypothetical protein C1701_23210 [Actinoalloteichus sp. AHMU CJ021]MCP2330171.1 FAD-NAD(P)-binding [Actinoalloteichus caeruleus DSM 43889]
MRKVRLAVVGAGPTCTYVVERLAATLPDLADELALDIHVFDRGGRFGAGAVHSDTQPETSFLNRIVGQVAFAADESVLDAGPLLEPSLRPTLYEWCRRRFDETGDPVFDVTKEDWPKRYVHGLALREVFGWYVDILRAQPHVDVHLHQAEVLDVTERGERLEVEVRAVDDDGGPGSSEVVTVDSVLFLTGHSWNDASRIARLRPLLRFAEDHDVELVPTAYPLEDTLTERVAPPGSAVGCAGMGLTTIDVILWLTEGRGGRFDRTEGRLTYQPSGREPATIVPVSEAGLFTFARPYNAKQVDLERFEHRGVFLTESAVDRLRASVGRPTSVGLTGAQRQLDFTEHLFPLVLLEMAHLYYVTLLGPDVGRRLAEAVGPTVDTALDNPAGPRTPEALLDPVSSVLGAAVTLIDGVLQGTVPHVEARAATDGWSLDAALSRFLEVTVGPVARDALLARVDDPAGLAEEFARARRPWGHQPLLSDNLFDWRSTISPVPPADRTSPERYQAAVVEFMRRDHLWAEQDNLTNPAKAAADGVWRDLRPVLGYAVDYGGLTAASHREFLTVYMRHHNRLANGAALEVMEKILALVECGIVDVSVGPDVTVAGGPGGRFQVNGPHTGAVRELDVLVDARVHSFDPELDTAPLYRRLLDRGLVRKWRNPAEDGDHFEPGGLDLTVDFHPVRRDGTVDRRLTFLGPPSEGVMFFQLGALRPHHNHHVMRDVLTWLREFLPRGGAPVAEEDVATPVG